MTKHSVSYRIFGGPDLRNISKAIDLMRQMHRICLDTSNWAALGVDCSLFVDPIAANIGKGWLSRAQAGRLGQGGEALIWPQSFVFARDSSLGLGKHNSFGCPDHSDAETMIDFCGGASGCGQEGAVGQASTSDVL